MEKGREIFDVAIIGGGIAGAGIARDAALRGLKVVLFEKATFGSGTSSKSSKLIHGGIRYLELAWLELKKGKCHEAWKNFRFVFSSLKESAILEKIAPEMVRPIELVVPIYKKEAQNPLAVYLGTLFYGLLAFLTGNPKTPRILWGKKPVLRLIPHLNPKDLAGGVIIWDHIADDKRLVEETIRSAIQTGAQAFEHALVATYRHNTQTGLYELTVEQGGATKSYSALKLVNASGPWIDKVRHEAHEMGGNLIVPVAGSHITLKKFTDYSVILRAQDKRVFFVINTGGYSRVGTTERIHTDPDTLETREEEVEYLLCALERYFPGLHFESKDIIAKDSGIRPLAKPRDSQIPHAISREHEIRIGPTGVIHVLGVKLTDHRRAAEEVVDRIVVELVGIRPELKSKKTTTHLLALQS